jgi:hypothetical protein
VTEAAYSEPHSIPRQGLPIGVIRTIRLAAITLRRRIRFIGGSERQFGTGYLIFLVRRRMWWYMKLARQLEGCAGQFRFALSPRQLVTK